MQICCCSFAKSCPILCGFMECSIPGFPVLHYLPEFAQTHVSWVGDAIQPSHSLSPPSCPQSLPASGSFPSSWLFMSGGQRIGASASALVLPMNVQGWFPLGLCKLISCKWNIQLSAMFIIAIQGRVALWQIALFLFVWVYKKRRDWHLNDFL